MSENELKSGVCTQKDAKIQDSELENIIKLSKLFVPKEEFEELKKEMESIIKFADEINDVVDSDAEFDSINNLSNVFREDVVEESFDRDKILSNVDGGKDGFFCVNQFRRRS